MPSISSRYSEEDIDSSCFDPLQIGIIKNSTPGREYKPLKLLGQGAFGCTYKAEKISDGSVVALKLINVEKASQRGVSTKSLEKELEIMMRLSNRPECHLYVGCYYDHFYTRVKGIQHLIVVMELIDGISLQEYIDDEDTSDRFAIMWRYTDQLIRGLDYIHSRGVVHQDIKGDNIMIDKKTNTIKFIDFGLSCLLCDSMHIDVCPNNRGSLVYFPPEFLLMEDMKTGKSFRLRCMHDVWSLGVTLYEMWNGPGMLPIFDDNGQSSSEEYAESLVRYNYQPSFSGYEEIDYLLNNLFLAGGVHDIGQELTDLSTSNPEYSYLTKPPYRARACEILDYVDGMMVCISPAKQGNEKEVKKTMKKLNIPYEDTDDKRTLCEKLRVGLPRCTINKKTVCKREIDMIGGLLRVEATCKKITEKLTMIDASLRYRVTITGLNAIYQASEAKQRNDMITAEKLVAGIVDLAHTLIELNADAIDFQFLQGEYDKLLDEHATLQGKTLSANDEKKLALIKSKANLIGCILNLNE